MICRTKALKSWKALYKNQSAYHLVYNEAHITEETSWLSACETFVTAGVSTFEALLRMRSVWKLMDLRFGTISVFIVETLV